MAKKSSPKYTSNKSLLFIIAACILLGLLIIVCIKYMKMRSRWYQYSMHTQDVVLNNENRNAEEAAFVLATTITSIPAVNPLYKQPSELQNYIGTLSHQTGRDIVVVDKNEIILADTVSANVGKEYTEDKGEELLHTIQDGQTRTFIEKSVDYPQGISETVIPVKDAKGDTVGAILLSSSQIFK